MEKKLNFVNVLTEGLNLGLANVVNLILLALLYVLTVWIPYLNIGTTIGLYKAIAAMSRGEMVQPTSIFSKDNFAKIGDFFLLQGLKTAGSIAAAAFMFVPAMVVGIAWSQAMYLFVDKNTTPLESLSKSYAITRGEKWTIFFVEAVALFVIFFLSGIIGRIKFVGGLLAFAITVCGAALLIGVEAVIYRELSSKLD